MQSVFIDPGKFRSELVLEDVVRTSDGQGGHHETWHEVGTIFAQIEPVNATALFGADQTLESVTHRVSLRAHPNLVSGMRFRKGSRIFDIVTVHDPDESGRYLICRTREVGR